MSALSILLVALAVGPGPVAAHPVGDTIVEISAALPPLLVVSGLVVAGGSVVAYRNAIFSGRVSDVGVGAGASLALAGVVALIV